MIPKKKRRRKNNELIKSSGNQTKPTGSVLALCEQYCNEEIDNYLFRREYFRLVRASLVLQMWKIVAVFI